MYDISILYPGYVVARCKIYKYSAVIETSYSYLAYMQAMYLILLNLVALHNNIEKKLQQYVRMLAKSIQWA